MYRDPMCYIADVEDMTNSSYRTARRIMAKAKAYYGVSARTKITIQQMKAFLVEIKKS